MQEKKKKKKVISAYLNCIFPNFSKNLFYLMSDHILDFSKKKIIFF